MNPQDYNQDTFPPFVFTVVRAYQTCLYVGMALITATSHAGHLPISDGRSAESRYLRRVGTALIAQCGSTPSASQKMLIYRIIIFNYQYAGSESIPGRPGLFNALN
jgi:hypothetical protein